MHRLFLAITLALLALPGPLSAQTQQSVTIGDKEAILHVPPNARASAVLVPGKGGIDPNDPLLRNRAALNACDLTPVAAAESFVAWAGGRATLQLIGGAGSGRDPCGPNSAHGFWGADAEVVDGIVRFVIR